MKTTLDENSIQDVLHDLDQANHQLARNYPGETSRRQPVHTIYGGAHLFKFDTAAKMGRIALKSLQDYAPNFVILAQCLQIPGYDSLPIDELEIAELVKRVKESGQDPIHRSIWLAHTVYERILHKLETEPVEDFRLDFEDGFGNRPDAEEDEVAIESAKAVARGMREGTIPPYIGIRIKPFNSECSRRGIRTLDLFLGSLIQETNGQLPENFVVTLPKVEIPQQVSALVSLFEKMEDEHGLKHGSLEMEIMIETTQSIFDAQGRATVRLLTEAAKGRCIGAHFGTYDYTASCSVTAQHQQMDNPVCDFARHVMKVALGGSGIFLSDGATNVMPVGPHRPQDTQPLTPRQIEENINIVQRAWKLDYDHIQHSLSHAYYQGWDLHPHQIPIRYAACYTFFLEGFQAAATRLRNFMEKAAQATLTDDVFDDAATGQGLLNYFLRALNCGAISEKEVEQTGLSLEEIRSRSFLKILENRRSQSKG